MADLRTLPTTYVEGSRWPPGDFNAVTQGSLAYDENWQREHTDDPEGEHDSLRIAYAGGYVAYAGGTSYAAAPQSHIAMVTRISAGVVEVKLDFNFRADDKWSCIVWSETVETSSGEVAVELTTGKLVDRVQIRLSGSTDQSFYFFAFGVK